MGKIYRFAEAPSTASEVLRWFLALEQPPMDVHRPKGVTLHFDHYGSLAIDGSGILDPAASPLVSIFLPQVRRGILWTIGEVHFLATPLRKRFPPLQAVSSAFSAWLAGHEQIFPPKGQDDFSYFLEGSVRNNHPPVFALPSGLAAIREGRYFVGDDDNDSYLDRICRALRLRGVTCTD